MQTEEVSASVLSNFCWLEMFFFVFEERTTPKASDQIHESHVFLVLRLLHYNPFKDPYQIKRSACYKRSSEVGTRTKQVLEVAALKASTRSLWNMALRAE